MIYLEDLTKIYNKKGKENRVEALRNVNLHFDDRGLIFINGKSGSGKTTLLNILGGLDSDFQGDIKLGERNIKSLTAYELTIYRNKYIGFIFQDYNLLPDFTVKENIELAMHLQGGIVNSAEMMELLSKLDIDANLLNRKIQDLSGGQKQRIAIARAMIKKPKILLADEPTGALDTETSREIFQLLKEISKDIIVIVASHDLEYSNEFGDRLIYIENGRVVKDSNFEPCSFKNNLEIKLFSIKSKFYLKNAIKMSFSSLKLKKLRIFILILLCSLTFITIGLISLTFKDRGRVLLDTLHDLNQNSVIMYQSLYDENKKVFSNLSFEEKHMKDISKKFPHISLSKIFGKFSLDLKGYFESYNTTSLLDTTIQGAIEIENKLLEKNGFELLKGHLPSNNREIVITKYVFDLFKENGYKYKGITSNIHNYEDLLNRYLNFENNEFQIVGILDTKNSLINDSSYQIDEFNKFQFHDKILVKNGFIEEYLDETKNNVYINNIKQQLTYGNFRMSKNDIIIKNVLDFKDSYFIKDGIDLNKLAANQFIIPLSFARIIPENDNIIRVITNNSRDDTRSLLRETAEENFNRVKHLLENDPSFIISGEKLTPFDYVNYIEGNPSFNKYEPDFTFNNITKKFIENRLIEVLESTCKPIEIERDHKKYQMDVVGFYYDLDDLVSNSIHQFYTSEENFTQLMKSLDVNNFHSLVVTLSGNIKEDIDFLSNLNLSGEDLQYRSEDAIVSRVTVLYSFYHDYLIYFWCAEIILLLFSILFFSGYTSIIINHKKKDIGILKALGANKKDICSIFVYENSFILCLIFITSIMGTFLISSKINDILLGDIHLRISIFSFNLLPIVFISFWIIITLFISSYVPLKKYLNQDVSCLLK